MAIPATLAQEIIGNRGWMFPLVPNLCWTRSSPGTKSSDLRCCCPSSAATWPPSSQVRKSPVPLLDVAASAVVPRTSAAPHRRRAAQGLHSDSLSRTNEPGPPLPHELGTLGLIFPPLDRALRTSLQAELVEVVVRHIQQPGRYAAGKLVAGKVQQR